MDSELLTCFLKFIEYCPDYLSALLCTLLHFIKHCEIHTTTVACVGYTVSTFHTDTQVSNFHLVNLTIGVVVSHVHVTE